MLSMNKKEKVQKILEMYKRIFELLNDGISQKEIDDLYIETKNTLEVYEKIFGDESYE